MNNYTPDSLYMTCSAASITGNCTDCYNQITTNLYPGNVYAPERVYSFGPFGKGESSNTDIFMDQRSIRYPQDTTWGRVPQLTPRSLTLVGLDWRTS